MTANRNPGDKVTYKSNGVCTIESLDLRTMPGEKEGSLFYVLRPLADPSVKIFVPANNEELLLHMRPLLSPDEMLDLFNRAASMEMEWIEDMRARAGAFRILLAKGDREEIAAMIKRIMTRRVELLSIGKKLYATDETALKKAEKMLFEEAAYVLEMSYEDVLGLFAAKIAVPLDDMFAETAGGFL